MNVQPTTETCHSQESSSNLMNPRESVLILLLCMLWSLLQWSRLLFLLFETAKYFLLTEQPEENMKNLGKSVLVFSP